MKFNSILVKGTTKPQGNGENIVLHYFCYNHHVEDTFYQYVPKKS